MFTVYMKGNSLIFQSGFETWGGKQNYMAGICSDLEILKSYENSKDIQENKIKLVHLALLTLDVKVV